MEFFHSAFNRLYGAAEDACKILDSAKPHPPRFDGDITPLILLGQRLIKGEYIHLNIGRILT
jgi:hypothetical protein